MSESDQVLELSERLNQSRFKRPVRQISQESNSIRRAEETSEPNKKLRFLNRKSSKFVPRGGVIDDAERGSSSSSSANTVVESGPITDDNDDFNDSSDEENTPRYRSYVDREDDTDSQTPPYVESEKEDEDANSEEEDEDAKNEKDDGRSNIKPEQSISSGGRKVDEQKDGATQTAEVEQELAPYTSSDEEEVNDGRQEFKNDDEFDFEERTSNAYTSWIQKADDGDTDSEDESEFTSFVGVDTKGGRPSPQSTYLEDIERSAFEDQLFIKSETKNPTHSAVELQVLAGLSSIAKSAQNENDTTHNETYQRLMHRASEEIHAHHNNLIRSYKHKPEEEKILDALSELLRRFSTVVQQVHHQEKLAALSSALLSYVEDPYSKEVLEAILKMQEVIRDVMKHNAEPKMLLYYTWADRLALRWLVQCDMHGLKMERRRRMVEYATELRENERTRRALREARDIEKKALSVGLHPSHSLHYFRSILNFVESGNLTYDWDEPQSNMGLSGEHKINILDKVSFLQPEQYARTVVDRFLGRNNISKEWAALFDIIRLFVLEVQGSAGIQQPWIKNKDPELVDMVIDAATRATSVISLDHTTFPVHLIEEVLRKHTIRDDRPNMEELEKSIKHLFPVKSPWRYYNMSPAGEDETIDVTWLMHNVFVVPPEAPVMRPTRLSVEAELQLLGIEKESAFASTKVIYLLSRMLCPELYSAVAEALKFYISGSMDELTVSEWKEFVARPYSTQLVCALYNSNKMNNNSFTTEKAKQEATKRLFTTKALFANPSDPLAAAARYLAEPSKAKRKGKEKKGDTRKASGSVAPSDFA